MAVTCVRGDSPHHKSQQQHVEEHNGPAPQRRSPPSFNFHYYDSTPSTSTPNERTMRAFSTLVLGAVALLAAQHDTAEAFSPSARAKILTDLKEMKMSGAGGAASPDYYVEGEFMYVIIC